MGNRAERRASAKIARQAIRRARSPTEGAILRAAAAFASDETMHGLDSSLSADDFDPAWARLSDDLDDILAERYSEFRMRVYAEAGIGRRGGDGSNDTLRGRNTRLFLCPLSGSPDALAAFAGDKREIDRLETSLREFGVIPEDSGCFVFPLILPISAFAPEVTSPGMVRALHDDICARLIDGPPEHPSPSRDDLRISAALSPMPPSIDGRFGALAGIELVSVRRRAEEALPEDESAAEELARAAAIDSWHDSYAANLSNLTLGAPVDWPACAAALAWETIRLPLAAALEARGVIGGRPDTLHCAPTGDGERFVASAAIGDTAIGPFSTPSDLVWMDADEFFARAEASVDELREHGDEGSVLAPLLGSA